MLENFKKLCFHSESENLPNIDLPITLGCFYNKELVSVAGLFYLKNDIADIYLIPHPAFKDNIIISKAMITNLGRICFKKIKYYNIDFPKTMTLQERQQNQWALAYMYLKKILSSNNLKKVKS